MAQERRSGSEGRARRPRVAGASFKRRYDLAPDMFAIVDTKSGRVLDCNRALVTCIGYPKREIVGRSVLDLYDPEHAERARQTPAAGALNQFR